jgi:DNA primase catalytic core
VQQVVGYADPVDAAKDIVSAFNVPYTDVKAPKVPQAYKDYVSVYKYCSSMWVDNAKKSCIASAGTSNPDFWLTRGLAHLIDEYGLGFCPQYILKPDNTVQNFRSHLLETFPAIPAETMDTYGLYNSLGDCVFAGRYIFTIYNSKGDPVAFSGRSLSPNTCKYYNTSETAYFKKSKILYNWNVAKKKGGTVILTEGFADALTLVSAGYTNAIACMGTSFTQEHLDMLKNKQIILALDNDSAGMKAMIKTIEENPSIRFLVFNYPFKEKDFNDAYMHNVSLKNLFDQKNLCYSPEYLIRYFKTQDLSLLGTRAELYDRLNKLCREGKYNPVEKDYYNVILSRLIKGKRGKQV